jgi:hypothetical protein
MNSKLLGTLALVACVVTSVSASSVATASKKASTPVTGDYVEARTASVFAGACHYNGELVTTGRDAVLAWSISSGSFNGVDLSGVKAMAAVTSDDNLSVDTAPKKTELTVDSSASAAQVAALADLLRSRLGSQIGTIAAIHQAPISFAHGDKGYSVDAKGFGNLTVDYRTDNACCIQPSMVWYNPITPLEHRKVGFTETATYSGAIADPWQRHNEDSAFYGTFTF